VHNRPPVVFRRAAIDQTSIMSGLLERSSVAPYGCFSIRRMPPMPGSQRCSELHQI
jgi:hypothetical protein